MRMKAMGPRGYHHRGGRVARAWRLLYIKPGLRGPGGAHRTPAGRLADCFTELGLRIGPQTASRPESAVSQLLSGWGPGINLSPPSSVQSQDGFHAAAGRTSEGARSGRATPVGFSKPLCAVAAGRARAAGEQGAAQSPQARAGGVGARRGAARAAPGPGEWSNLTAGTRRRRAAGNGGGGGGAGRHREAWAVTRAPERGPMVLEGPRRPVLQVRRAPAGPLCVRAQETAMPGPPLARGPRGLREQAATLSRGG